MANRSVKVAHTIHDSRDELSVFDRGVYGPGYGPVGQFPPRAMALNVAPPVRGPSVVVPRSNAPPSPIRTHTRPPAVAPPAATAKSAKSGVGKLIDDVRALHPDVEANFIKDIETEYRKERGGKLSGSNVFKLWTGLVSNLFTLIGVR